MRITARVWLYGSREGQPARGHIDGRSYSEATLVYVWLKRPRGRPEEFRWTLHRGNAAYKNLRGPFASVADAVQNAKAELAMFDGTEPRPEVPADGK
jgi:hypothetical protein